jgi:hypothetical protein
LLLLADETQSSGHLNPGGQGADRGIEAGQQFVGAAAFDEESDKGPQKQVIDHGGGDKDLPALALSLQVLGERHELPLVRVRRQDGIILQPRFPRTS